MKDWSDYGLPLHLGISDSKLNKLKKTYPDHTQCQSAIIELFLNKHPAPNWELVCCGLYQMQEYEILEVVQSKYFKGSCLSMCGYIASIFSNLFTEITYNNYYDLNFCFCVTRRHV